MDDGTKEFIMTFDINFIKKFEDNFNYDVNLSNYSWFNLGGNAEYFFKAKDKKQLIEFLREAKKKNLKTIILGAGSNTLFRDNGVQGAVIKLGNNFSSFEMDFGPSINNSWISLRNIDTLVLIFIVYLNYNLLIYMVSRRSYMLSCNEYLCIYLFKFDVLML